MRAASFLATITVIAILSGPSVLAADSKRFGIEFETGPLWQTRNDARIPSATGTQFSLIDSQGKGPFPFARVYVDYALSPKHELRFLAAPLSLTETGNLSETTLFEGVSFAAGTPTQTTYRFNSYRITYRYLIHDGDRWNWKLGITGKIRDAEIMLRQGGIAASNSNVGFVPLLHLDGEARLAERWRLNLNLDGLAAPQGRAFDASLKLKYELRKNWALAFGYRTLEGGADTSDVYSFAWLHYAVVSLSVRF